MHRGRFLVLLICLLLCLSAPATLLAIEIVSDMRVAVSIFNSGPSELDKVTVKSGDHESSLGDLASGHGQVASVLRVAKGQIVIHSKGAEGDQQIFQLPSDDIASLSIAIRDGKVHSYSVTARRRLWWR